MKQQITAAATTIGSHVPLDLADAIARLARENERSVSGEVRLAIRRHLATARETKQTHE